MGRPAGDGQGQPDRPVDAEAGRRLHHRAGRPGEPAALRRLPVDRLRALHPAGRARRGPAQRPLGRNRQDRMRHHLRSAVGRVPAPLVAVAHGSRIRGRRPPSPNCGGGQGALARLDLRTAFLGHAPPSLPQVLGTLEADREVTVLPLLLTAAYHSKTDIPGVLARTPRPRVQLRRHPRPAPAAARALERRLAEADRPGATRTRPAPRSSWPRPAPATRGQRHDRPDGGASGRPGRVARRPPRLRLRRRPTPAAAVAACCGTARRGSWSPPTSSPLAISPTRSARTALAAGAAAVSPALGACAEVADVMLDRFAEIGSTRRTAA